MNTIAPINYPPPPQHVYCDIAYGLGVAAEAGGALTSMLSMPYFGIPLALAGRFVRVLESSICKSSDLLDAIWNSPMEFALDLIQVGTAIGYAKGKSSLQRQIKRFDNLKKARLHDAKISLKSAQDVLKRLSPTSEMISGSTEKILKRAGRSREGNAQTIEAAKHTVANMQLAKDAIEASTTWAKRALQIFKPTVITANTAGAALLRASGQHTVKKRAVKDIVDALLELADAHDIKYNPQNLNIKAIAASAYTQLSKKIIDAFQTYWGVCAERIYNFLLGNSKQSIEKTADEFEIYMLGTGKAIFGLENIQAIDEAIASYEKSYKQDGIIKSVIADGNKPVIDHLQIAKYALLDLDPDVLKGLIVNAKTDPHEQSLIKTLLYSYSHAKKVRDLLKGPITESIKEELFKKLEEMKAISLLISEEQFFFEEKAKELIS